MRKPTFWFSTWSDTNQAVQLQKMPRGLNFRIYKVEGLYYLSAIRYSWAIYLSLLSRSFVDHLLRCGGWLNSEFSKREKHSGWAIKTIYKKFLCFFVCFLFNVPVNNFSVMLRRSHLFLGITSTFGE